jgi:hypothetical protein
VEPEEETIAGKIIQRPSFLGTHEHSALAGLDIGRIGFIGIDMHAQPEVGMDANKHVAEDKRSFPFDFDTDPIPVLEPKGQSVLGGHVDVPDKGDVKKTIKSNNFTTLNGDEEKGDSIPDCGQLLFGELDQPAGLDDADNGIRQGEEFEDSLARNDLPAPEIDLDLVARLQCVRCLFALENGQPQVDGVPEIDRASSRSRNSCLRQ